jgi:hypothetical protein
MILESLTDKYDVINAYFIGIKLFPKEFSDLVDSAEFYRAESYGVGCHAIEARCFNNGFYSLTPNDESKTILYNLLNNVPSEDKRKIAIYLWNENSHFLKQEDIGSIKQKIKELPGIVSKEVDLIEDLLPYLVVYNKKALSELEYCMKLWTEQEHCSFGEQTNCSDCGAPYVLWKMTTGQVIHGSEHKRLTLNNWKDKIHILKEKRK